MMKIILVGYSGHAYVVADAAACSGLTVKYYSDKQEAKSNPYGLKYLGFEGNDGFTGWKEDYQFILGIGDNTLRQKIAGNIERQNKSILNVIHPSAILAKNATLGHGTFIAPNVTVNPLASIGKYVILNTSSIIEHECIIEDGVHIAPGAVLAGNVYVGKRTFVGANAVVKQGIRIGKDVVIGAGTVVLNHIADGMKVVGNPGKIL
jgi:sugar O-acyltransferase (sialic acid O-acetyltransferase NeuD family)